ncbi:P-loop NTPase fold protein, partial [Planctomycetota bacterium]
MAGEPKGAYPRTESVGNYHLSDAPTVRDTLGFGPYVEAIAAFLLSDNTQTPLTLSIEGGWGSGKTSFMLQLKERLVADDAPVVWFSAWRHDGEESLWAAFALAFVEQLARAKGRWARAKCAWELFKVRFDWLRGAPSILQLTVPPLVAVVVLAVFGYLWVTGVLTASDLITGAYATEWMKVLGRVVIGGGGV